MINSKYLFSNLDLRKLIVPLVIEQILSMLVGMVDTVMVSYAGEAAISGVALVDMINYLFITVFSSIATGGAVIVSQYLGDRQKGQANLAASQLYTISALISGAIAAVCLLCHRQILHPTSFNLSNTLRAAGDVKYTMYTGIASMIVFRLGSAVLFAIVLNLGVIGVWIAMGSDWLARSVAFWLRYRSGKWKAYRAI